LLRLDGLSLHGFKSFADRTELRIPDGVTAVVGPNGCGKSNILDAIAWVLGEQSAKSLRGSRMEDVIFTGSRSRKPAGMAEVNLHFSPRQRPVEVGPDGAPLEVADDVDPRLRQPLVVTRRLYRNGDSEYLINNERARLKDIAHLIVGTGMGTRLYSIIEQGRVDQILNSKPLDRRILIEEAAGITRYKIKRKAAKLKLDEAEQSLLRVTDIIAEIEKQLRSLRRQAQTARRYRRLSARRRLVLRAFFAEAHSRLGEEMRRADDELARRRAQEEASARTLAELEETGTSGRTRVAALEAQRDELSRTSHGLDLQLERARSAIVAGNQRLADLAAQVRRAEEACRHVDEELAAAEARRRRGEESLARLDADLSSSRSELERHATAAHDVRERLQASHRLVAETKEDIFEVMSEAAGARNRRLEVDGTRQRLAGQVARLAEQVAVGETELAGTFQALGCAEHALNEAADREENLRQRSAAVGMRLEDLTRRAEESRRAHEAARRELDDAQWQLAAATETVKTRAAYAEGVRRFLDEAHEGVLGTVADFAAVKPGDELACEKALGPCLQAVVLASRKAAEGAALRLESARAPEVTLLFPDDHGGCAPSSPDRQRGPVGDLRTCGHVADSLSWSDPKVAWLRRIVPDAWIVQRAEEAVALARAFPAHVFVSRDGLLIGPGGVVSAGRPRGEGEGILETRARQERLRQHSDGLAVHAGRLLHAHEEVESARRAAVAERETVAAELAETEKDVLSRRHEVVRLRHAADAAQARQGLVRLEHDAVESELRTADERLAELEVRLSELGERRSALEARLSETQDLCTRLEGEIEAEDAHVSRLREEVAVKAERREAARLDLTRVETESAAVEQRRADVVREIETLAAGRREAESAVTLSEGEIEEGLARSERLRAALDRVEEEVRGGRSALVTAAERLHGQRVEHDRLARLAAEAEMRRQRVSGEIEHLASDCHREMSLSPVDLPRPEPPDAVEELGRVRGVAEGLVAAEAFNLAPAEGDDLDGATGEESEADADVPVSEELPWVDGALDVEAVEAEAERLRVKLERIGPVNLVAIEEYEELSARHQFLTKEQADLLASIKHLRDTIAEIDQASRDRFVETFRAVAEKFDEAFQTLFRGGRAELRLQDENDPLECGIEIIAQPPGKRLQNMMLLSGGEKALSAIALLFALFKYKPSPFCVLDEVDAPLDETNVLRFMDLVTELAKDTQFVVITHNRRSMERSQLLHGVTMEEPGCSKLVSVSFRDLERETDAA
jgi:chromosome segregation protein